MRDTGSQKRQSRRRSLAFRGAGPAIARHDDQHGSHSNGAGGPSHARSYGRRLTSSDDGRPMLRSARISAMLKEISRSYPLFHLPAVAHASARGFGHAVPGETREILRKTGLQLKALITVACMLAMGVPVAVHAAREQTQAAAEKGGIAGTWQGRYADRAAMICASC